MVTTCTVDGPESSPFNGCQLDLWAFLGLASFLLVLNRMVGVIRAPEASHALQILIRFAVGSLTLAVTTGTNAATKQNNLLVRDDCCLLPHLRYTSVQHRYRKFTGRDCDMSKARCFYTITPTPERRSDETPPSRAHFWLGPYRHMHDTSTLPLPHT